MSYEFCSSFYDVDFEKANGLTWLPWIGRKFPSLPAESRFLIVGESHYVRPKEGEDLEKVIEDHLRCPNYTRDVVWECLIYQEWPNRTLDTLPKLLFGSSDIDRELFWSDAAFYNLVQNPMHYNREGSPERPSWEAFVSGWATFMQVVRILQPSHCLFIGVEAFNSFNYSMTQCGGNFTEVSWTEQVGRTYGRKALITTEENEIELIGVQHLGKYCSWSSWREYLGRHHPDLMLHLGSTQYTRMPNKSAQAIP